MYTSSVSPFGIFKKLSTTLFISFLILSAIQFNAQAQDTAQVEWMDYEDARALKSDKPIFVFGEMAFCSACKKMKKEVFSLNDIAATLNQDFVPVRMHTLGIFPNTLNDIMDEDNKPLKLAGSPGFVVIKDNKYSVFYGFQSAETLRKVFAMVLKEENT